MKKFYSTLALAAAVALSASAADFKAKAPSQFSKMPVKEATLGSLNAQQPMKAAPAVSKAKPATIADVYGYYHFVYGNIYTSGWAEEAGDLILSPGENENEVYIDGINNDYPIVGVFDPAACTLSIADHQEAFFSTYYNEMAYFEHIEAYRPNPEENRWTVRDVNTALVLSFDEDGSLVFPENDGFKIAIEQGGWLGCMWIETSKTQAPDNTGWTDFGQATFSDGWYIAGMAKVGFDGEVSFPAYDVKLYRNNENTNLYRLYDPYATLNSILNFGQPEDSEDYLAFNQSYVAGCIEFDITDPECVIVNPTVYSGLDSPIWSMGLFYMYNNAGQFVYVDGPAEDETATKEDLIEGYKAFAQDNGEADKLSTYNSDARVVTIKDGIFSMSSYPGYTTWDLFAGLLKSAMPEVFGNIQLPIDMTSVIILPDEAGINNVIMDNSNKTLEYYNLQGIRVNNPENGIYIRRQGNDVQKVYVR